MDRGRRPGANHFVDHVRMRSTVTATLDKAEMLGILDRASELADRLWKQMREVGYFDLRRNFRFWFLAVWITCGSCSSEGPLEAFLRAIDIEALAVLTGNVVKESPDARSRRCP